MTILKAFSLNSLQYFQSGAIDMLLSWCMKIANALAYFKKVLVNVVFVNGGGLFDVFVYLIGASNC